MANNSEKKNYPFWTIYFGFAVATIIVVWPVGLLMATLAGAYFLCVAWFDQTMKRDTDQFVDVLHRKIQN